MSTSTLNEKVLKYTSSLLSDIQSKSSIEQIHQIKISKNDVMKSQIEKILTTLGEANQPTLCFGITRDVQKLISIIEIVKQKKTRGGSKLHQYNCLLRVRTKVNPYQKSTSKNGVEVVDFSKALKVAGVDYDNNGSRGEDIQEEKDNDEKETERKDEDEEEEEEDGFTSDDDGMSEESQGQKAYDEIQRKRKSMKKEQKRQEREDKITKTQEEKEAQREIKGDKMYDVPVMFILLSGIDLSSYLDKDWTIQS
ncbi:hypothetical protein CORT_0H02410 [Candida orthopsilosis Co 90-125]|uniref:Uncharacterized protein n=1 Tax=Candida orthopsilosis (strain 90-125) TaxID=1136231 RepID=H8XBA2_CANO9|nr:hypothetical protein CORT_0H02410 [Candida orthopsilosis Co 90-125]CCG25351.1 hypothetical protein CORT_0H02410 [Candida orthopsilosis Co 90-125]